VWLLLISLLFVVGNPVTEDFRAMVNNIIDAKPDLILGGTRTAYGCTEFVKQLKEQDFSPRMLALRFCITTDAFRIALGEDARYIVDYEYFDRRLSGRSYEDVYFPSKNGIASPEIFHRQYTRQFGQEPSGLDAPRVICACAVFHQVLQTAETLSIADVDKAFDGILAETFFGRICPLHAFICPSYWSSSNFVASAFDYVGRNAQTDTLVVQHQGNDSIELIAPLASQTSALIYPFPSWKERIESVETYSTTLFPVLELYMTHKIHR